MDDEDSYIFCGTPLLDPEDGPSAQKQANRELQVRDEKGRQRFHGAFTGGFSAGYFNSVGSKEGWTPSTFVSSRSKGADHVEQCPEDFMDEEDFGEFGIAPRKIHTTAKFRDGRISGKRKAPVFSDSVIPGEPPLKELVQPVAESIGIQILMKMGWKPGQGIGPRVKGSKKQTCGADEITSSMDLFSAADDPMLAAFTFAPEDTTSLPYTPKDDNHGIGYSGLSTKSVLSAPSTSVSSNVTKSFLQKSKKKLLIAGKAFGIGALEDDDDIDIYSHEDMSQYDFTEFTASQPVTKKAERRADEGKHGINDGLDGFVKSEKALTVRKKYPLPPLPAGYTPVRKSVHTSEASEPGTSKHQILTAEDRSLILGERKFTMAFKSSSSSTSKAVTPKEQSLSGQTTSAKIISGFQPFINDPEKQKRYEAYLKLGQKKHIKTLQPAQMTEWEKAQELEEFARAASLYQPLSNMLSSRFVSRTHQEAESQGGLVKMEKSPPEKMTPSGPSHKKCEWHPAPVLCKRFNICNPYTNSSIIGVPNSGRKQKFLFDHLTFEDNSKETTAPEIQVICQAEKPEASVKEESNESPGPEIENLKVKELSASTSEEIAPGVIKPPMDLFKAIFENTSDEDEEDSSPSDQSGGEDEEGASSSTRDPITSVTNKPDSTPVSTPPVQNKTPVKAFGVFANIDFDMLSNSHVTSSDMVTTSSFADGSTLAPNASTSHVPFSKETNELHLQEKKLATTSEGVYGPQLPPPSFIQSCNSETKPRSHKHSRRKEKHKHHKHQKHKMKKKSKKQKKKRSSKESARNSNTDSGSSEGDDIDPSVIIKKLNDLHKKTGTKYCKN